MRYPLARTLYVAVGLLDDYWYASTIDHYASRGVPVGYFRGDDYRLHDSGPTWFCSATAAVRAVEAMGYNAEVVRGA